MFGTLSQLQASLKLEKCSQHKRNEVNTNSIVKEAISSGLIFLNATVKTPKDLLWPKRCIRTEFFLLLCPDFLWRTAVSKLGGAEPGGGIGFWWPPCAVTSFMNRSLDLNTHGTVEMRQEGTLLCGNLESNVEGNPSNTFLMQKLSPPVNFSVSCYCWFCCWWLLWR